MRGNKKYYYVMVIPKIVLSLIVEPDALFHPEECSDLILKGLLKIKT